MFMLTLFNARKAQHLTQDWDQSRYLQTLNSTDHRYLASVDSATVATIAGLIPRLPKIAQDRVTILSAESPLQNSLPWFRSESE